MNFSGVLKGYPRDMRVNGDLITSIGKISTDINIRSDSVFYYSGNVKTIDFHAGKFFEVERQLGKITLEAKMEGVGLDKKSIDANVVGKIESVSLNQYVYKNVSIAGDFKKEAFHGEVRVNDRYLKLKFQGMLDLSKEEKNFKFLAKVEDIYPRIILGAEQVDSSAHIQTDLEMDLRYVHLDSISGSMEIDSILFRDKFDTISVPSFYFASGFENKRKYHRIRSDILDFDLKGRYDMLDGFKTFQSITQQYFPNVITKPIAIDKEFEFSLTIHDFSLLEKLLSPGLSTDSGTTVNGKFRSSDNHLDIRADIFGFRYGNFSVDTTAISLS